MEAGPETRDTVALADVAPRDAARPDLASAVREGRDVAVIPGLIEPETSGEGSTTLGAERPVEQKRKRVAATLGAEEEAEPKQDTVAVPAPVVPTADPEDWKGRVGAKLELAFQLLLAPTQKAKNWTHRPRATLYAVVLDPLSCIRNLLRAGCTSPIHCQHQ